MTEGRNPWEDEQDLERLGRALGLDPDREPPEDRVASVRAAAERMPTSAHRRARGSSRRALLLGGVAASAGVVAGYVGRDLTTIDEVTMAGPPTEKIVLRGTPSGVTADARLINHTWGTELLLDVSGLPAGEKYEVVYRDRDGKAVPAGSFVGVADVVMVCRFNAAPLREDVQAIDVFDQRGGSVMRAVLA